MVIGKFVICSLLGDCGMAFAWKEGIHQKGEVLDKASERVVKSH